MQEINLVVMIEVMPGKRQQQLDAYAELKPLVLAEEGCLQYELFADAADENKFVLIEKWASAAALDAHDQSAHMRAAAANNPRFRAGPAQVIKLACIGA